MSRVYFTSKWGNIPRERVDSWIHEDRSRLGRESLLSSRTLRCGNDDRIFISRPNRFFWVRIANGINKFVTETSEEILVASVVDTSTGKLVAKARPRPTPTLTLSLVSILYRERKWIDVEPGKIQSRLFWSVKIYDQIVATWWYSLSRRW